MTTKLKWDPKDPQDIADYWVTCATFLQESGETITTADVTVPDDIELILTDWSDTEVRVRLGGGVAGKYDIVVVIDTTSGERFRMKAILTVADRVIKQ